MYLLKLRCRPLAPRKIRAADGLLGLESLTDPRLKWGRAVEAPTTLPFLATLLHRRSPLESDSNRSLSLAPSVLDFLAIMGLPSTDCDTTGRPSGFPVRRFETLYG